MLIKYAASAEVGSEHLLGQAIVDYARDRGVSLLESAGTQALPGQGIRARVDGSVVLVGSKTHMQMEQIFLSQETEEYAAGLEEQGNTVVFVAVNGVSAGLIALRDKMRDDARETVQSLQKRGIDVLMITGDNETTAEAIARETGINRFLSGVFPSGKAAEVSRLRSVIGHTVVVVGDGINDAPALAAADVGIAMSTGSDVSLEAADVVLMKPGLAAIPQTIEISQKTFRVIRQNLFWAFFYNIAAIPLAAAGALHPIVAAGAMALSSVTVVLNSLRLK